jgi:hypothetical protein
MCTRRKKEGGKERERVYTQQVVEHTQGRGFRKLASSEVIYASESMKQSI